MPHENNHTAARNQPRRGLLDAVAWKTTKRGKTCQSVACAGNDIVGVLGFSAYVEAALVALIGGWS